MTTADEDFDILIRRHLLAYALKDPCFCGYCADNAPDLILGLLHRWMAANHSTEQTETATHHIKWWVDLMTEELDE